MSIWIYKKDKTGRTNIFTVEVPLMLIPMLLGIIACLFVPFSINDPSRALTRLMQIIFTTGFILILIAKISLFRQGIWCSWGWGLMKQPFKTMYCLGYLCILFGVWLFLPLLN